MIFDDALPSSPENLEYHDTYKLFEINGLIAINFLAINRLIFLSVPALILKL